MSRVSNFVDIYTDDSGNETTDNYTVLERVGDGRFGKVYKVKISNQDKQEHDDFYAVKTMEIFNNEIDAAMTNEISLMECFDHPNIIALHRWFIDNNENNQNFIVNEANLCMVMPLFEYSLYELLINYAPFDISMIQCVLFQILDGLTYLHEDMKIIHRDLTPVNILINLSTKHCVIADFGRAKDVSDIYGSKEENGNSNGNENDNEEQDIDIVGMSKTNDTSKMSKSTEKQRENDNNNENNKDIDNDNENGNESKMNENKESQESENEIKKEKLFTSQMYPTQYRSPELLLGSKIYDFGIDIWALGCIFAQMCFKNGKEIVAYDTDFKQLFGLFETLGGPQGLQGVGLFDDFFQCESKPLVPIKNIVAHISNDEIACDLLSKMLTYNPKERINAESAFNHALFNYKWLDDHDWTNVEINEQNRQSQSQSQSQSQDASQDGLQAVSHTDANHAMRQEDQHDDAINGPKQGHGPNSTSLFMQDHKTNE